MVWEDFTATTIIISALATEEPVHQIVEPMLVAILSPAGNKGKTNRRLMALLSPQSATLHHPTAGSSVAERCGAVAETFILEAKFM